MKLTLSRTHEGSCGGRRKKNNIVCGFGRGHKAMTVR